MSAETAVLRAEADALRRTILDAVRGLIERHPDLIVRIDGNCHAERREEEAHLPPPSPWEVIGTSAAGPILVRLSVDVGVTGH